MPEFKELVQTWHDTHARHLDHRDECLALAKKIHDKVLRDWKWPEEFVAIYRLGRKWGDPIEKKRIIREAMDVDEEGSWFFGLELTVPTRHSDDPHVKCSSLNLGLLFYVGLKKTDNGFSVRTVRGATPLTVLPDDDHGLAQVLNRLADAIKDEMRATYPAEGATQVQRRIGFPARPGAEPQQ